MAARAPGSLVIGSDQVATLDGVLDHYAADSDPTWSPNGRQIAFVSRRDGNDELYLMAPDGSGLRRLTNDAGADVTPRWSPDGEWLAFRSNRVDSGDIYRKRSGGQGEAEPLVVDAGIASINALKSYLDRRYRPPH